MKRDDPAPPVRYCPACDRALPPDTEADNCPGCAEDRRRAARRREWERARARLGPRPLERCRDLALEPLHNEPPCEPNREGS